MSEYYNTVGRVPPAWMPGGTRRASGFALHGVAVQCSYTADSLRLQNDDEGGLEEDAGLGLWSGRGVGWYGYLLHRVLERR